MALEDPAEVPALDAKRRRRLHRADRRGTRELIEEGHLAEDIPRPERRELGLLAAAVLNDVHLARADDERAHAGVALPDDVLPGFVALLDRGVRDGLERFLVEILEHRDAFQEVDARRRHGRMLADTHYSCRNSGSTWPEISRHARPRFLCKRRPGAVTW